MGGNSVTITGAGLSLSYYNTLYGSRIPAIHLFKLNRHVDRYNKHGRIVCKTMFYKMGINQLYINTM